MKMWLNGGWYGLATRADDGRVELVRDRRGGVALSLWTYRRDGRWTVCALVRRAGGRTVASIGRGGPVVTVPRGGAG